MSKRVPRLIIEDILECIEKIITYTDGMNHNKFIKDSKTKEAVYRNFEVMGEAANRMPDEFTDENSEIEWHKIISTRNIIIHAYDEIDDNIIWNVIHSNLPELKMRLEELLKKV